MASSFEDLLQALPQAKPQTVSLLDALPDPNQPTYSVDYDSKPSLLESHPSSMSAAEEYAILLHKKQRLSGDMEGKPVKKRRTEALPKKKKEKRNRGKQIKLRTRGNQRGVTISKQSK